jgi:hypothetical protein
LIVQDKALPVFALEAAWHSPLGKQRKVQAVYSTKESLNNSMRFAPFHTEQTPGTHYKPFLFS